MTRALLIGFLSLSTLLNARSQSPQSPTPPKSAIGQSFSGHDSLAPPPDSNPDATSCLSHLLWAPSDFPVITESTGNQPGDFLIRFPSPAPSGDAINDRVALEWYQARNPDGQPVKAPAVVIVHESGRGMAAARTIARGLRSRNLHSFVIHLPGYGARTSVSSTDIRRLLPAMQQAVADVRRARDAVATLPQVDASLIGLQGTSLGGFITATVAGLDHAFQRTFIFLAGGQIAEVLIHGTRDAAGIRNRLAAAGIDSPQIRSLSLAVEPMRLAHRINPATTWLFSGKFDEVVPPRCSLAFATAASLPPDHHRQLPVGHYSAALLLPIILQQIGDLMAPTPPAEKSPAKSP
jgi:dienelactone hydrolase